MSKVLFLKKTKTFHKWFVYYKTIGYITHRQIIFKCIFKQSCSSASAGVSHTNTKYKKKKCCPPAVKHCDPPYLRTKRQSDDEADGMTLPLEFLHSAPTATGNKYLETNDVFVPLPLSSESSKNCDSRTK